MRLLDKQRKRYHRNITICGNRFVQCPKPRLYAVSASDISLFNNWLSDSCGDISLTGAENVMDYDK